MTISKEEFPEGLVIRHGRIAIIRVHKFQFTKEIIAYQFVINLDRQIEPGTTLGCYHSSYLKDVFLMT